MEYFDPKQISELWGISERRVTQLCLDNKIKGAYKDGKTWRIPSDTKKPIDGRFRKSITINENQLPLPIGISDFKTIESEFYYVDKTLFIKDIIDSKAKVSLFTRPRRFGKTLNMNMLKVFFEISKENTDKYFFNHKIWKCGEKYREYQGKYPVIYLSFKDVKYETWNETFRKIRSLLQKEYIRHKEIIEINPVANRYEIGYFNNLIDGNMDEVDLTDSLSVLTKMLNDYYDIPPVIIIDEYDTPIQQGYLLDYYNKVISFMRNFFSSGFKDNTNLTFGFMTGILRIAKESIFSGMNNLKEYSILSDRYCEYFGFTKEEVAKMFIYYNQPNKLKEACIWYDGYKFGKEEIFNPWSIINYLDENYLPRTYWERTGNNDIIREIVSEASDDVIEKFQALLRGESIVIKVDTSVIYPEIKNDSQTIFSFLLIAGYLKIDERIMDKGVIDLYRVSIPNREVSQIYVTEIISVINGGKSKSTATEIQRAIIQNDIPLLQRELEKYLMETVSMFDTVNESFYQGLMLGLYTIMNNKYRISSNRESGYGRFDIQMAPIEKQLPGLILELKVLNKKEAKDDIFIGEELRKLAQLGLDQINNNYYIQVLKDNGVNRIIKMGVAFFRKHVEIVYEIQE